MIRLSLSGNVNTCVIGYCNIAKVFVYTSIKKRSLSASAHNVTI